MTSTRESFPTMSTVSKVANSQDYQCFGMPLPANDEHAISVTLPSWEAHVGWGNREPWATKRMRTGYPRFFIHAFVDRLALDILSKCNLSSHSAMLYPNLETAQRCATYIRQQEPGNFDLIILQVEIHKNRGSVSEVDYEVVSEWFNIYAVAFPKSTYSVAKQFWQCFGEGISSREAQLCQKLFDAGEYMVTQYSKSSEHVPQQLLVLQNVSNEGTTYSQLAILEELRIGDSNVAKRSLRAQIASLYGSKSIPAGSGSQMNSPLPNHTTESAEINPSDVDILLYPTGMSALAAIHRSMLEVFGGKRSVCYGFPYVDTLKVLSTWGPGCQFYGHGSKEELDDLESRLSQGEKFLGIFCEVPTNPLMTFPDLKRIRTIAKLYSIPVVIDDTLSTAVNVDLTPYADVIWSSLTKAFSGKCNVMGGSVVVNPKSPFYISILDSLTIGFKDTLFPLDAIKLEENSREFESRIAKMNENASKLAEFLNGHPVVERTYFPPNDPSSKSNYDECRRTRGGYSYLLTVRFKQRESAIRFFDVVRFEKGPSLGTEFTLVSPYVLLTFPRELEWAEKYSVVDHLIRISVGVEDPDELIQMAAEALDLVSQDTYDERSNDMAL